MQAAWLMVALSTLGVDVGWQPLVGGGFEYIIQIEPETLEALRAGQDITSFIPPELRGVRQYRITVGRGPVPRQGQPPQVPAEVTATPPAQPTRSLLGNSRSPASSPPPATLPLGSPPGSPSATQFRNNGAISGSTASPSNFNTMPPVTPPSSPVESIPANAGSGLRYADEPQTTPPTTNPSRYSGLYDTPEPSPADRYGRPEATSPSAAPDSALPGSQPLPSENSTDRWATPPGVNRQSDASSPGSSAFPTKPARDQFADTQPDPFELPGSDQISSEPTASEAVEPPNRSRNWDRYAADSPGEEASTEPESTTIASEPPRHSAEQIGTTDTGSPRPFLSDGVAERLVAYHTDSEEKKGSSSPANEDPPKSWWLLTFTALLLFVSVGSNAYLGWLAWGLYHQCLNVLDRFRASRRMRMLG